MMRTTGLEPTGTVYQYEPRRPAVHRERNAPSSSGCPIPGGGVGPAEVVVEREAVVVSVAGEIDAHTAPLWWTAMEHALSTDKRLVVDLTETTFMDSAGLMVLQAARQRLGDDPTALVVRGPNGLVA